MSLKVIHQLILTIKVWIGWRLHLHPTDLNRNPERVLIWYLSIAGDGYCPVFCARGGGRQSLQRTRADYTRRFILDYTSALRALHPRTCWTQLIVVRYLRGMGCCIQKASSTNPSSFMCDLKSYFIGVERQAGGRVQRLAGRAQGALLYIRGISAATAINSAEFRARSPLDVHSDSARGTKRKTLAL